MGDRTGRECDGTRRATRCFTRSRHDDLEALHLDPVMLWVDRLPREIPRHLEDLNLGASRARLQHLTLERLQVAMSKKPGGAGSGRTSVSFPYTDQRRQTYEFDNARRTLRTGATTKTLSAYEIMQLKQFEVGAASNSNAQRDFMRRAEVAEEARREHFGALCLFWSDIKSKNQRAIDHARAAGSPDRARPGPAVRAAWARRPRRWW